MNDKRKKTVIAVAAVATLGLGGAAVAGATGGAGRDDDASDAPIQGQALDRAKQVALDQIGEGKVTGTEVGDEEGAYEVEVTRADGSQVDVHLDKGFNIINQADDSDQGADDGENESEDKD